MNPYIALAVAEQRNAEMRSQAAARRLARAIKAKKSRSRAQVPRVADCISEMPMASDDSTAARPLVSSRR
jgi:hypothetical protein